MRTLIKVFLSALIILILVIAILPTLISTNPGRKLFVSAVQGVTEGTLQIEELRLHWFGRQEVRNLTYKDAQGREVLTLKEATSHTSLLFLLFNIRSLGTTQLKDLSLHLYPDHEGQSQKAFFPLPLRKTPLQLENGTLTIHSETGIAATVQNISLSMDPEQNLFSVSAQASEGAQRGSLEAQGSLYDPIHITATLSHFPIASLASALDVNWLSYAVGGEVSGEFILSQKGEEPLFLVATIQSPTLQATVRGIEENGFFVITPESEIHWQVSPLFFKEWLSLSEEDPLFLADKTNLAVHLKKIAFPLRAKKRKFEQLRIEATLQAKEITVVYKERGYLVDDLNASLVKEEGPLILSYQGRLQNQYKTLFTGSIVQEGPRNFEITSRIDKIPMTVLEALSGVTLPFGESVTMELSLTKTPAKIGALLSVRAERATFLVEAKGTRLQELQISLDGNLLFQGKQKELLGEKVHLHLTGPLFTKKGSFQSTSLKGAMQSTYLNATIEANVGKEGAPFSWELTEVWISGNMESPPFLANSGLPGTHPFHFHLTGAENKILFDVNLSLLQLTGSLHHFTHNNAIDFSKAEWALQIQADSFPTSAIAHFFPHLSLLPELIGSNLTLHAEVTHNPTNQPHTSIEIDAKGEGASLTAALTINGQLKISQENPAHLYYEITPERIESLLYHHFPQSFPPYLLHEKALLDFTITSFSCPTSYPGSVQGLLCKSGFSGRLTITPLTFVNERDQKRFTIEKIEGKIVGEDFSKDIFLQLDTNFTIPTGVNSHTPALHFSGNLSNLFTETGTIDRSQAELKGQFRLEYLPTEMLLGIAPMNLALRESIEALLGTWVSATADIDIREHKGPLHLSIQASNFKATCPLYLTQQNELTLTDTLEAEIELTHKVNEKIIKDINPILISGIYSSHPLRLTISPDGFLFPLSSFSLRKITINRAKLDIGKIDVVYGGEIQKIMEFVKAKQPPEKGVMSAWFTPIYFALQEGELLYQRFDLLLAGNVHLAFWGKIDLNKDKVWMMMAIGPETLQRSFGIKGLTSKEMFHVKMRGSTSDVELDWSAAKRRMGVIIAASAGGPIGTLVGSVVEKIVTSLGDTPSPPPTTQPFPWQK